MDVRENMYLWVEKYRPQKIDDCILPESLKKTFKEFYGYQNDVESGVGGTLGGASNKEPMQSYKDMNRNIQNDYGLKIKKKKKTGESK